MTFALIASESLDTQGFQIGAFATHLRKGTETVGSQLSLVDCPVATHLRKGTDRKED